MTNQLFESEGCCITDELKNPIALLDVMYLRSFNDNIYCVHYIKDNVTPECPLLFENSLLIQQIPPFVCMISEVHIPGFKSYRPHLCCCAL